MAKCGFPPPEPVRAPRMPTHERSLSHEAIPDYNPLPGFIAVGFPERHDDVFFTGFYNALHRAEDGAECFSGLIWGFAQA